MPIIIPQVNPESVEPPRIQPAADETTFGGGPGLAAEGQGLQETAGHVSEIAEFAKLEKIRADQTAVQAGSSQLAGIANNLVTDPKEGLPAYQGVNAMTGHDKILETFDKNASEIGRLLQPDQQNEFNRQALVLRTTLNSHANAYVGKQLEQHDTNTFNAAFTNYMQTASLNYGNPQAVSTLKDQIDKMVGARAKRLGYDDDETKAFKFSQDTKFHESVLSQMVNDPNMLKQAKEYLKDHKDEMDVDAQDRIRDQIDKIPAQRDELSKKQQADYYKANMKQAMENMWDGKMSLGEAQRLFRDDKIDKADYDLLASKYDKPDAMVMNTFVQSDPATFNAIRNAQLTGSKDPRDIQRDIAQGFADKKLSADDGKYLQQISKETPPTPRDKYIEAAAQTVRDSASRYLADTNMFGFATEGSKQKKSQQEEDLVQQFYSSVDKSKAQSTKQIDDLRDHIIMQGAAQRYPGLGKLDKMPDVVIDIKGNVTRLLNPDQHSGLKPKYKITPTAEAESDKKQE